MSTGRKCGLDSNRRLIGSAVMSSRLVARCLRGGIFSLSSDVVWFFSLCAHCASAVPSSRDARFRSFDLLLDFRGIGMGGVDVTGGYVAERVGCGFSVSGCIASSLISLRRRRFLNGQIGIIRLLFVLWGCVSHPAWSDPGAEGCIWGLANSKGTTSSHKGGVDGRTESWRRRNE